MTQTASLELRSTHPLAGVETWPKTGPIYGIDVGAPPSKPTVWQMFGDLFKKRPDSNYGRHQARVWY